MDKFSITRSSYYHRVTRLVNPVGYFYLAKEIDNYWAKIQKHYRRSKISLSIPNISPTLRAIELSKFSELYEKQYKNESLIKYGLNQVSSRIIKKSNWDVFEAYLLKCRFSFPNTLQIIANILITYHHYNYDMNYTAIKRFCNNLMEAHSISDHHNEVSWLLWICKELRLNLKKDVIRNIEEMSSSICVLIVLDLFNSEIIKNNIHEDYLKQFHNKESLYSESWLLAYEAGKRLWLKNEDHKFITHDTTYNEYCT
ncbi:hypothetical protein [Photorhabdus tasmaniensis]|uniref:Uncharacterized protein n=1 Tax=Photorhabdus tasmaniensis TaxID=1004159 RepID=A0ABX0GG33_9GAMM|nr:hypothetical protein [Photorhabdus tasmaniensis]NHB88048.1 hypothetical protein [Photorhabdus tasmaniensis]